MKKFSMFLLLALNASFAFSQALGPAPTPSPTPDPEAIEPNMGIHVEPFADMVKLNGAAGTATVAGLRVPFLPKQSLLVTQWMVPAANSTFTFGEYEYRVRLDHIITSPNILIPLNAIQVFARGGLGVRRADGAGNEFAYTIQGGASIAVGKVGGGIVAITPKGGFLGSGALKTPGTKLSFGSSGVVGIELGLKF